MYTIGKIAKLLGVGIDTIRHYKDLSLLHPHQMANRYMNYDNQDALITLITKELSSMDIPLADIKNTIENRSIREFSDDLSERHTELERKLKRIQDELIRVKEIEKYVGFGIDHLNSIDEFQGTDIYSIPIIGAKGKADKPGSIKEWVDHFPFTYISVNIAKEEINDSHFKENYTTSVGIGSVERYVKRYSLPIDKSVNVIKGGLCLRTCIAVKDLFSIENEALGDLRTYAETHGYKFSNDTSGRLLFIENFEDRPLYYILVWVRVEGI